MTRQIVGRSLQWIGFALMGIGIALFLSALLHAQERIALATPEVPPTNTAYSLASVTLDDENVMITIALRGVNGERAFCVYRGTLAQTLLTGLNKANLSTAYAGNATTGSLKQRIYHRLVVMNEAATVCGRGLAGTITGTVP